MNICHKRTTLVICDKTLNEAGHLIIVIIKEVIVILLSIAAEGHDVGALTELHMAVAQRCVALEQDLLAGDLLLAWHLADLETAYDHLRHANQSLH